MAPNERSEEAEIDKLRRMMAEGVSPGGVSVGGEMALSPEMARELQEKEAEFTLDLVVFIGAGAR